jgi:hypothetical protein
MASLEEYYKVLKDLDEIIEMVAIEKKKWGRSKMFTGNPIEKRKNSNLEKYKKVAQYMAVLEKYSTFLTGHQRKACELAGVNEASFSSWKNKRGNYEKFLEWRKGIGQSTLDELTNELRRRLGI